MIDSYNKLVVGLWLVLLFIVLVIRGPGGDPPAPTSPALAQGSAVNGAPVEYAAPLTYEERFSAAALGPSPYNSIPRIGSNWAWAEAACEGCPIATAAVQQQGVGE